MNKIYANTVRPEMVAQSSMIVDISCWLKPKLLDGEIDREAKRGIVSATTGTPPCCCLRIVAGPGVQELREGQIRESF